MESSVAAPDRFGLFVEEFLIVTWVILLDSFHPSQRYFNYSLVN
jgi:hypothetical protein